MEDIIKVIEWESELQKLAIDKNIVRYYNENPGKKESYIEKLYKIRDSIVEDSIGVGYKDRLLAKIHGYIDELIPKNSQPTFNSTHEFLLYALAGAMLAQLLKDAGKNLEDGIASGIKEGFYKTKGSGISE